jgi:urease accessory protein
VRVAGALLLHDVVRLSADEGELAARMGRFDVLAIAVVAGAALRAAAAEIVSRVDGMPVARRADRLLAATPLGSDRRGDASGGARADAAADAGAVGHGCVLRIAGTSVEQVGRTLRELLAFVPALLGDDPWMRKW